MFYCRVSQWELEASAEDTRLLLELKIPDDEDVAGLSETLIEEDI